MSSNAINTYNCKQVIITLGTGHIVTGYAEDNFISFEPLGDGVTPKYGCDGEISRAIDPNDMYSVKLVIQQSSSTNEYLQKAYAADRSSGEGLFAISVADLSNKTVFDANAAWVSKPSSKTYGKDTNNREWTMYAAGVTVTEDASSGYTSSTY